LNTIHKQNETCPVSLSNSEKFVNQEFVKGLYVVCILYTTKPVELIQICCPHLRLWTVHSMVRVSVPQSRCGSAGYAVAVRMVVCLSATRFKPLAFFSVGFRLVRWYSGAT